MIDQSRPMNEAEIYHPALTEFSPVPRQKVRHDGWTPDRQRRFIEALADLGSVKSAAHAVNMTPEGAYLLRRHPQAEEFRAAWEAALSLGVQRLEDAAMERALFGVEVPVYHFGAVVGTRRVYNDRLLMFMLRNRAPRRFAADSLVNANASTQSHLARLKREWRAQWQAELEAESEKNSADIIQSLDARLEKMHQRSLALQSPRTRELYDQYREAEEADRAKGTWPEEEDGDGEAEE